MALTPKQQQFVAEYLVDLNATQAAIRAGYSEKSAKEQACRLLTNVNIQEAIAAGRLSLQRRTEVTQEFVINGLVENLQRAMQASPVLDREGNEVGTYTWAGAVANKALELLGKHLDMFKDRVEINESQKLIIIRKVVRAKATDGN